VNAECQASSGGVDRVDHTVDFIAPEPHGMQDGAKDFLLQIGILADSRSASAQTKVPEAHGCGQGMESARRRNRPSASLRYATGWIGQRFDADEP